MTYPDLTRKTIVTHNNSSYTEGDVVTNKLNETAGIEEGQTYTIRLFTENINSPNNEDYGDSVKYTTKSMYSHSWLISK